MDQYFAIVARYLQKMKSNFVFVLKISAFYLAINEEYYMNFYHYLLLSSVLAWHLRYLCCV